MGQILLSPKTLIQGRCEWGMSWLCSMPHVSPYPQVCSWVPLPPAVGRRGNPESLSPCSMAQPWLPAPGWKSIIITFLKPGQIEGAGDIDGGAGAPVGPTGIHVKCPVAEEPFQWQREGEKADGQMLVARPHPALPSQPAASTSEGASITLNGALVPHTSLGPQGILALGIPSKMWRPSSVPWLIPP